MQSWIGGVMHDERRTAMSDTPPVNNQDQSDRNVIERACRAFGAVVMEILWGSHQCDHILSTFSGTFPVKSGRFGNRTAARPVLHGRGYPLGATQYALTRGCLFGLIRFQTILIAFGIGTG